MTYSTRRATRGQGWLHKAVWHERPVPRATAFTCGRWHLIETIPGGTISPRRMPPGTLAGRVAYLCPNISHISCEGPHSSRPLRSFWPFFPILKMTYTGNFDRAVRLPCPLILVWGGMIVQWPRCYLVIPLVFPAKGGLCKIRLLDCGNISFSDSNARSFQKRR
jgi:hypothetical protein